MSITRRSKAVQLLTAGWTWNDLLGQGAQKSADQMMGTQVELGKALLSLMKQQQEEDLSYRKSLYDALQARMGQQYQRFMPQATPYVNPYANVVQRRPGG